MLSAWRSTPSPARWIGRASLISGRCWAGGRPTSRATNRAIEARAGRGIKRRATRANKRVRAKETSMAEEHSIIELTVPPDDVEDAVARVCDEWGVDREAVQVDQLDASAGQGATPDRVLVRITLLAPDTDAGFEQDDETSLDPELEQARSTLQDLLERMRVSAEVVASLGQPDPESEG